MSNRRLVLYASVLALFSAQFAIPASSFADDDTWVYEQKTGKLSIKGEVVGEGYSGNGDGLNNPKFEGKRDVGPIPRGNWKIGEAFKHGTKGPITMTLTPHAHDARGRDNFLIHGDNKKGDKSASEGCIILSKELRTKIAESKAMKLKVVE